MKLYATVTSERATKGQGGNKHLNVNLLVGSKTNQYNIGNIYIREVDKNVFKVEYYFYGDNEYNNETYIDLENNIVLKGGTEIKAKRQKGEKCAVDNCNEIISDNTERGLCDKHNKEYPRL